MITDNNAEILYTKKGFKITVNQCCVAEGYRETRLYWLDMPTGSLNAHIGVAATPLHIWHQRMGHMSHDVLEKHSPSALKGMDLDRSVKSVSSICAGCKAGKSTQKPFPRSSKKTDQILEIIHSDLAGLMQTKSLQGSLYISIFIDNHSHHVVVYHLRSKDQFATVLHTFLSWVETQMSKKLHVLHSNRGGKYLAASVKDTLNHKGIKHHLTMPGSPQQNGKAEQFNWMILDKAMSMLHMAGLSNGFWEYAINAAVHIYNCSPSHTLQWQTQHEIWTGGHIPDVSYFHIFGCKGYMHIPADKQHKLDVKATEVTLIGYESESKGYRLWDKHTCSVHLSQDVTFDKSSFPSLLGDGPCPAQPPIFILAITVPNQNTEPLV